MFDALTLDVDKPQRLVLLHPVSLAPLVREDGAATWLDLYGADSDRAQAIVRDQIDRMRRENRALTAAELREGETAQLAACVAGWSLCGLDGAPLDVPCTPQNAAALFALPGAAWLREQALAFVRERGNFLRRPSIN